MKRYLLYFLCFFICIMLVPGVYRLLPESLKGSGNGESIPAEHSEASGIDRIPDTLRFSATPHGVVAELSLSAYIAGVMTAELPDDAPTEMLKAMAVVIRTYALYRVSHTSEKHPTADVCGDPSHCRAYLPEASETMIKAVEETEGEVILYNGRLIDPITHISSSVRTESAENAFGQAVPYLISAETPDESEMKDFFGKKELSKAEFARVLANNGYDVDADSNHQSWLGYVSYTTGGRVKTAYLCGNAVSGAELVKVFSLRSSNVTISTGTNGFVFATEGIGHGVGMSLYGAWIYALNGTKYEDIIVHYYNGAYIALN